MSLDYKAVVFDMDGVIFDSERLVVECWQVIADKHNMKDVEMACRECFGCNQIVAKERFLKRYGKDFPYESYKKEMSDLFHSRYDNGRLPMKQGVLETFAYLKEQNKKIALATSTRKVVVESELRAAGIFNFFDAIVCGDMVKESKPKPDIYIRACQELKVEPREAYAVEDSYNGIRSAYFAGLMPIMIPDMVEPDEEMEKLSFSIISDLNNFINFLKKQRISV